MYKSLFAIIVAAGCAAVLVGLVPPPAPAEAKPSPAARGADIRLASCTQAWPYYEQSCLRGNGRADGDAGAVRVIAASKPASERIR